MNETWLPTPLDELLTERQEKPEEEELLSGKVRIVGKIGFNDGKIHLREDGRTKTGMILIRPGDLVVSGINAAKGAIAIYDRSAKAPIAATIHYGSYIPNETKVEVRFLWWLLRSSLFRRTLDTQVPGGIKTELKAKRLLPVKIPIPSPSEQRRIVKKLEDAQRLENRAQTLRVQIYNETAAIVGARLYQLQRTVAEYSELGDILLEKPRNGWSARCDNIGTGIPVLSLKAVTGFDYKKAEYKRTNMPTEPNAHYWLNAGDLLITRSNTPELVGHAAIYDGTPTPCIYPDLMMRLRINSELVDKRFVWYWLQSPKVRDFIMTKAKGTSPTMKKISQGIVMEIPFPKNMGIQKQIQLVGELDALKTKVTQLTAIQCDTLTELSALLPSILDKAFKGEL